MKKLKGMFRPRKTERAVPSLILDTPCLDDHIQLVYDEYVSTYSAADLETLYACTNTLDFQVRLVNFLVKTKMPRKLLLAFFFHLVRTYVDYAYLKRDTSKEDLTTTAAFKKRLVFDHLCLEVLLEEDVFVPACLLKNQSRADLASTT